LVGLLSKNRRYSLQMMISNHSINMDWLTAGFARFQPAGYVKR
jgi:hypothetical protein